MVVYKNADNAVHLITCMNRDIYVGKCLAINEILAIEGKVNNELLTIQK